MADQIAMPLLWKTLHYIVELPRRDAMFHPAEAKAALQHDEHVDIGPCQDTSQSQPRVGTGATNGHGAHRRSPSVVTKDLRHLHRFGTISATCGGITHWRLQHGGAGRLS